MEEGGTWEEKRSGGWEKRNKKRRRNGKSINLLGQHVTKFLTKYCMAAYWHCTHVHHSKRQLTSWVRVNRAVHVGREVKQRYATSSQKLSHASCVLSCTLVYFIYGLSANMGASGNLLRQRCYKMLDRISNRVRHERERWEKGNKKRNGKSINLLVRLVTEILTKYCMVAWV